MMARSTTLVLVALLVSSCMALSSAVYCCPSCTGNNGECYVADEIFGSYTKGKECLDACPGSCVKGAGDFFCGLEPCGPLACPGADVDALPAAQQQQQQLRGSGSSTHSRRLSAPVGTCLPGRNASGAPLLTDPTWWGSYSYHVSMAIDKMRHEQIRVADHWATSPASNGFQVSNGGNTMYWPTKHLEQWTLNGLSEEALAYNFSLGSAAYAAPYAATDEIIFTFALIPATNTMTFLAYDAQHGPNTLVSNVTLKNTSPNGDEPQVYAEGTQVYARMGTVIHTWDAFMPDSARIIKVDVSACNVPGTKDQATHLDKAEVRGGKLMFTANFPFGDDPDTVQLCATDLTTGKTTPLLTDPQYTRGYDSLEVLFFDNAVLYTSSGGTINVGDPVACLISSPSAAGKSQCYWLNSDIMQNGNYAFTKLYTNYHIPSNPDGLYQWTIYEDVVLYRTYAETFTYSYFGYNLTSKQVYPIALVYGVPNTDCYHFTGDGSDSYEVHSFVNAFMLANGTLLLHDQYTSEAYGEQQHAIVHITSPLVRPDIVGCPGSGDGGSPVTGGCGVHGGTCIAGQCYCQPGCSGADCREGQAYCNPAPPKQDDDF